MTAKQQQNEKLTINEKIIKIINGIEAGSTNIVWNEQWEITKIG